MVRTDSSLTATAEAAHAPAYAKVNLALHVTGRRDDGYHLLDSLVVFADVADRLWARPAPELSLSVSGDFAAGVPLDDSNLVLRAARALGQVRGLQRGAVLHLEKALPHAAGIGSGSADAAAALSLLAELWQVPPLAPDAPEVLALGADVPVCVAAPAPRRMAGIGEKLTPVPALPSSAVVLVRPPVNVPTAGIFAALDGTFGGPMADLPAGTDFDGFLHWLTAQRNDLQAPATTLAPAVSAALSALRAQPQVAFAGMSGSGATCFGLTRDRAGADQAAKRIAAAHPDWWVAPAAVL